MENKTIDLKDLSIEQLKAFAYDQIGKIQKEEKVLNALNAEIASRHAKEEVAEAEQVEEDK
jgi:hypothetical protein